MFLLFAALMSEFLLEPKSSETFVELKKGLPFLPAFGLEFVATNENNVAEGKGKFRGEMGFGGTNRLEGKIRFVVVGRGTNWLGGKIRFVVVDRGTNRLGEKIRFVVVGRGTNRLGEKIRFVVVGGGTNRFGEGWIGGKTDWPPK